jgi:hypothetical protein
MAARFAWEMGRKKRAFFTPATSRPRIAPSIRVMIVSVMIMAGGVHAMVVAVAMLRMTKGSDARRLALRPLPPTTIFPSSSDVHVPYEVRSHRTTSRQRR